MHQSINQAFLERLPAVKNMTIFPHQSVVDVLTNRSYAWNEIQTYIIWNITSRTPTCLLEIKIPPPRNLLRTLPLLIWRIQTWTKNVIDQLFFCVLFFCLVTSGILYQHTIYQAEFFNSRCLRCHVMIIN